MRRKLIRITTIPISLEKLLTGQLEFMKTYYDVIAVSSESENLKKYGKKNNLSVFPVEMTRKITPIKDIKAIFRLYSFFKREKPFIVHTHTPKAGLVGMIAAKMAGVPNRLHTVAGLPLLEKTGFLRKILNLVEKLTYSCATKVYPNSNTLKQIIINENFTQNDKLKVFGKGSSNGIDTTYFNPNQISDEVKFSLRGKYKISEDDFVYIFVGRLVKDKGINELAKAFDRLSNENEKIKLLLVGPQEPDLDPLSKEVQSIIWNNNQIISVGYQEDVRPFFAIANVLVFPSYREGFPNVVMQAGAMGLPSIVSDINGCNEIVMEGINGVIVPVKNEEVIFEKMKDILNKEFYLSLSSASRKEIVENYEREYIWREILNEYKRLEENV